MLLDIYRWFTEGFATKSLQEAKAVVEELAFPCPFQSLAWLIAPDLQAARAGTVISHQI